MKKIIFVIFLFSVVLFSVSSLAEVRVRAYVEPPLASPKSLFTLTVEIEYKSAKNIQPPRLPKLSHFYLIGERKQSQVAIIGTKITKKKIYHYDLQPMKEGKFKIGQVKVIVDGKIYTTSPVEVEVSAQAKPRRRSSPFHLPFGGMRHLLPPGFLDEEGLRDMFPSRAPVKKEDIFFKLEVNKDTLYLGEMILAEWFFYFPEDQAINVIRSEIVKSAKLDGFWVESIFTPGVSSSSTPKPPLSLELNGKRYRKQLVISSALFPVRQGNLTIDSIEMKHIIIGSGFSFFSSSPLTHKSDKKQIKVLPLPVAGKGDFFTEAVGDFDISVNVNKKTAVVQEPVVYKVIFKGKGHPRLIRLPDLKFGDSFAVYDITESQKFSFAESLKTFEVILIPKTAGDLTIPSFELSSFDPNLGVYKTHILPSFKLKVMPALGGGSTGGGSAGNSSLYFEQEIDKQVNKQDKGAVGEGSGEGFDTAKKDDQDKSMMITPLALAEDQKFQFLKHRKVFWLTVYSLLFLFFVLGIFKNFLFFQNKKLFNQQLKENLKRVDQAIKAGNWKKSGIELNQLMYFFLSELSPRKKVAKNWDILLRDVNPSIRVKYESRIKALVSRAERLSFASVETAKYLRNQKSVERLKKEMLELIQEISS